MLFFRYATVLLRTRHMLLMPLSPAPAAMPDTHGCPLH